MRLAAVSSRIMLAGHEPRRLLAGRPPFEAEGMPALLKKIAEEEPVEPLNRLIVEPAPASPVQRFNDSTVRDLQVICLKSLAKEPSRRYGTALELANDLRRWLAGEPILVRETNAVEKLWLWSRRHSVTASLIAAVFALLFLLVVGLSFAAIRIADSRRKALQTVETLESQKANDLLSAGSTAEAIALMARRVRSDPGNWRDSSRLMWALQRPCPRACMTTLVEPAPRLYEARLVSTIVTAFVLDPAARWLYPDVNQYLTHFPDFVRAFAGKSFEYRTVEVVNGFDCAALWLPPEVHPDDAAIMAVIQNTVDEERLPDVFSLFEQMGRFHPTEAHWYLPLMGVGPVHQGRGCGSALLRRALARCDRDEFPAYLEATNSRNVALYERFGFKRVGRIQSGNSPEIIPMLRPPA